MIISVSKRVIAVIAIALLISGCKGFEASMPSTQTNAGSTIPYPEDPDPTPMPLPNPIPTPQLGLQVVQGSNGNPGRIVDENNQAFQIRGMNKMGSEYACAQGNGIFDGPIDQASIDAMLAWKINTVRIPMNEHCWLGINGVNPVYAGAHYQAAIADYVGRLNASGLRVILELHWSAPGTTLALGQLPMADFDHSPTFWSQVATAYKDNKMVIFDLFNEPYIEDWNCWVNGGYCAQDKNGVWYNTAGMKSLYEAVRGTGAQNLILLGGLAYSNKFDQWTSSVAYIPNLYNVAASWHQYDFNMSSSCPSEGNGYLFIFSCSTGEQTANSTKISTVIAAGYPVVLGEVGISAYSTETAAKFSSTQQQQLQSWLESLLDYMDQKGQGYLAWSWNTASAPAVISDYINFTPTPYFGANYKNHLSQF